MLFDFTPFSAGPDKLSVKAISGPSEVQVHTENAHTETQELRQEIHLLRADMQRMDRDRQQDRLHLQDALDSGLQQQQLELHLDVHEELAHERAHLRKEICQQI
ncbi:hypothetical protein EWM64_g6064 [Hericium alpestre]|uniref:Uncharacterized protein n=1 Tax=Hericium alpestre TaxID=135208 RepID=A0A4Y9ZTP3_9AGAM|nr:hypothetical protein EWM64_g6064 [Hericium alpestre]